jgi:hypothetical protein
MPIRNPFTRRPQADEGLRPPLTIEPPLKTPPGFERVDTVGSKASSAALSISSRRSNDTGEYKMSGTCGPPPRQSHEPPCHAIHDLSRIVRPLHPAIDNASQADDILRALMAHMLTIPAHPQSSMIVACTCPPRPPKISPHGPVATCRATRQTPGATLAR